MLLRLGTVLLGLGKCTPRIKNSAPRIKNSAPRIKNSAPRIIISLFSFFFILLHMIVETDPGAGMGSKVRLLHSWVRERETTF